MVRTCEGFIEGGASRPCVFNSTRVGRAAQTSKAFSRCVFCDLGRLEDILEKPGMRSNIAARLRVPWQYTGVNEPKLARHAVPGAARRGA